MQLSAGTAAFISLPLQLMKTAVPAESYIQLSFFIIICTLQRCLLLVARQVPLSFLLFNIFLSFYLSRFSFYINIMNLKKIQINHYIELYPNLYNIEIHNCIPKFSNQFSYFASKVVKIPLNIIPFKILFSVYFHNLVKTSYIKQFTKQSWILSKVF